MAPVGFDRVGPRRPLASNSICVARILNRRGWRHNAISLKNGTRAGKERTVRQDGGGLPGKETDLLERRT